MKAHVTVSIVADIEVDAQGEVCNKKEYTAHGIKESTWARFDRYDVIRQTKKYLDEHFPEVIDFEILEISE